MVVRKKLYLIRLLIYKQITQAYRMSRDWHNMNFHVETFDTD